MKTVLTSGVLLFLVPVPGAVLDRSGGIQINGRTGTKYRKVWTTQSQKFTPV